MSAAVQLFGAVFAQLQTELDWELLGRAYCEGDGSAFFDDTLRERILDTGLQLADDLARRLETDGPRHSLYVGAALAELAPLLVETLVLGRKITWLNLAGAETRELARALQAVASRNDVVLPLPIDPSLARLEAAGCDHLWIVSVLTDPEQFPALHDELYERSNSELATGRGSLLEERARAQELARDWLNCAAARCLLSTSDEELEILAPLALDLGWHIDAPDSGGLSAIVGDRVRFCWLER